MTDNTFDDPRDLAVGYALGILTPEETAQYEAFLAEHPRAKHQADDFAETVQSLAFDAPEITPPASMKADLMALIAQTPQFRAEAAVALGEVDPNRAQADGAAERTSDPVRTGEASTPATQLFALPDTAPPAEGRAESAARRRWFTRPSVYLSAAAAVAAIIVGGVSLTPIIGDAQFQNQQVSALEEIRQAPDAQQASGETADGGEATVTWSASLGKSVLTVDGLAKLPSDKTYELWYIDDSGPVPAGTFDAKGDGTAVRALEGTMKSGAIVAITIEDAGGSDAPTTDPILAITTA